MEQAKTRDHKIYINDVAISKVNPPTIPGFSDEQNQKFSELHKELLRKSMEENDSNETACLFDPISLNYVFHHGGINSVDILENPEAFSMLNSDRYSGLYLLHNHPSTKTFSYADIGVLLLYYNIEGITVITNDGDVQCLIKTDKYSFDKAYEVLQNIRNEYTSDVPDEQEDAEIVKKFIKNSKKTGIIIL
ncbi:MAG: hypothetical protein J1F11_04455 [Oscillospiraceae bacterium]|nr:hypothetical protein [Oscillospiraceae bacterium]